MSSSHLFSAVLCNSHTKQENRQNPEEATDHFQDTILRSYIDLIRIAALIPERHFFSTAHLRVLFTFVPLIVRYSLPSTVYLYTGAKSTSCPG